MIIIGKPEDIPNNGMNLYSDTVSYDDHDLEFIWEAIWFTRWHDAFLKEKKKLIVSQNEWINHLFHSETNDVSDNIRYELIVIQGVPLSNLKETLKKYIQLVAPGKHLLMTVRLEGEEIIKRLAQSIPIKQVRPYNGYYNRIFFNNCHENLLVAGLCLTKQFSQQEINQALYTLKTGGQYAFEREIDMPEGHFLYSVYPNARQAFYIPKSLKNRIISTELLATVYNCSEEDAVSLWNDMYGMGLLSKSE